MKIELMKKTLATIMALTVVCGAQTAVTAYQPTVGITAVAADIVDSGTCGENVTYTLDSNGVLAISGEGEIKKGAFQGEYPPMGITAKYSNYEKINRIEIYNGVTAIGDAAFLSCYNVKSVSLPVTLETIGSSAFFRTGSLTSIMIPESVESIGRRAFYQSGIESITTFPRKVETIEYETFFDSGLKKISIPGTVKSIEEGAFSYCSDLESVTIWNPECEIADFAGTISNATAGPTEAEYDGVIRGYAGSTAQAYAEKYNRKFEVIEEISTETTTTTTSTTSTTTTQKPTTTTTTSTTTTQKPTTTTTTSTTTTQKPTTTSTASTTAPETTTTGEITVVASGKCGENATWNLDSNGTLTISGEGKINDSYTWIDADTRKSVISIIIKEDISEISQLSYFDNLETVSMPSDVHFISHIDGGSLLDTFFKCPKLYFGTCGEYLTWEYDEKAMNLTINGQGAMQDFQTLMAGANLVSPWLNRGYEKIANVYLSKDVTSIGKNALYHCSYENEGVSYPTITVMNSDCDVTSLASDNRDQNGKPFIYVAKIRGYENSTAHTFALENDIPFEAIDEPVVSTTTTIITTSVTSTTTTSITTTTAANTTTSTTSTTTTQKHTTTSTTSATTTTKPVTSTTTTVTTQPVEYELGDVNDDGKLNAVDASIVLTYYAMTSTNQNGGFTEAQKKAADLDNNGDINAVDASYILSYYAYTSTTKEEIMPVEEYMKKK